MITQINPIPVQQKPQEQPVQTKADDNAFQSLLSNAASQLADKKAAQKNSSDKDVSGMPAKNENDSTVKDETSDKTAVACNNAVSLAAMLQQTTAQELPAQTKNAGVSIAAAQIQVQVKAVLPGIQQTTPMPAEIGTQANQASKGNNVSLPAQQLTSATVKDNSVSMQRSVNDIVPSVAQGDKQASAQGNVATTLPVISKDQSLPKTEDAQQASSAQTAPQATLQAAVSQTQKGFTQTPLVPAKELPSAETPIQTDKTDSSQGTVKVLPQALASKEEKIEPSVQAQGQLQSSARFTDLFSAGNVVIKVSDAPSTTEKAVCNQLTDKIAVNYKAGNPQFEMELHPQSLGTVSVKLAVKEGLLTVEISAANPKTQSMLIAHSEEIKSMLQFTANQPIRITEPPQEQKLWYQQQDQSNQPQQQERRQHPNPYLSTQENEMTTDNFLSLMQQLKLQAISV